MQPFGPVNDALRTGWAEAEPVASSSVSHCPTRSRPSSRNACPIDQISRPPTDAEFTMRSSLKETPTSPTWTER